MCPLFDRGPRRTGYPSLNPSPGLPKGGGRPGARRERSRSARSPGGGGPPAGARYSPAPGVGPVGREAGGPVTQAPERREAGPLTPTSAVHGRAGPPPEVGAVGFPRNPAGRHARSKPNRPLAGVVPGATCQPDADERLPAPGPMRFKAAGWCQAGSERKAVMVTDPASGPTPCQMGQPADHSGTAQKTGGLAKPIPWPAGGAPARAETPAGVDPVRASEGTRGAGPGMSARPPLDWAGVR